MQDLVEEGGVQNIGPARPKIRKDNVRRRDHALLTWTLPC
jgi:hypothetical protein